MGAKQSQLTEDELQDYKELTYLSRKEILHAFGRFRDLDVPSVNTNPKVRLPAQLIKEMPELKNNPFADRLCVVYSSSNDGCISFEDFLDMISVFSEEAPPQKKAAYAFKLYDFDNDGYLSRDDLHEMIRRLTRNEVQEIQRNQIIDLVLREADIDKDNTISPMEFEHAILKSGDFLSSFQLKL